MGFWSCAARYLLRFVLFLAGFRNLLCVHRDCDGGLHCLLACLPVGLSHLVLLDDDDIPVVEKRCKLVYERVGCVRMLLISLSH